ANDDDVVENGDDPTNEQYEEVEKQYQEENHDEEQRQSPVVLPTKPSPPSDVPTSKPKRYSSQRQRVTQQNPPPPVESFQEQLGPVISEGPYYEQIGYQDMYVSPTPPVQGMMGAAPLHHGEEGELPQDMSMQHGQPLGPLQHESMIHQRLAAMQQGVMASQEGGVPPRMMGPIPGMMAPHQMQPQQGLPTTMMAPMSQASMQNINPQTSGLTHMSVHPNYSSPQVYPGPTMMYQNSQYPMMGMNPFLAQQQMYGMQLQGSAYYTQPMFQQPVTEQTVQQRRRPNTAIPIKAPSVSTLTLILLLH
ncbi:hypothetical protein QZH41_015262, partial [Actinostola sp. cb2023]